MVKYNLKNTEKATKISKMKRELKGEQMRTQILFYIEDHPGLTGYEIAKKLGWSKGKTYYYIKQLRNSGEVKSKTIDNGKKKKLLYVIKWEEMLEKIPSIKGNG